VFDHVGVAIADLAASERFYRTMLGVLGVEPSYAAADMVGWDDWWIGPTDREHPVTRGLHLAFRVGDRPQVDAFWQAGIGAGYGDDGAPGPRPQYGSTYYGGFLLDPDGNRVEGGPRRPRGRGARRPHRPPVDPRPRPASLRALLHNDRPARRAAPGA
jgi:catechol 2,3-dioxygenase-like lactoylglutathione lyase family enzyme